MKRTADNRQNSTNADDLTLIRNVLDGQTEQFRPLVDRHGEVVQQFVAHIILSPEDAEEVTQDVLVKAFQSLHRYDAERASFRTWLLRIAYHTALKRLRHESRKRWVRMEISPDELHDLDTNELLNDTTNERIALLRQAVSELDPDDQMLLSLYYQDEQSLREIGYIVDHPDAYLRSRLQWLRKKIHQTIINLEQNGNKHK
ncbi:MAG: sigma-70 family RNA polymerase sigma factor [Bacteroidaceae bacterium]|nr:sigma-70 family RNA polymerase sigma factor [Bacteroidaceae bacterium]